MQNPILAMLNGSKQSNQNQIPQKISLIKSFLSGKDSNLVYKQLLESNPKFREFVQNAEGKTIEDLAMEYDIDLSVLKKLL